MQDTYRKREQKESERWGVENIESERQRIRDGSAGLNTDHSQVSGVLTT